MFDRIRGEICHVAIIPEKHLDTHSVVEMWCCGAENTRQAKDRLHDVSGFYDETTGSDSQFSLCWRPEESFTGRRPEQFPAVGESSLFLSDAELRI